MPDKRTFSGRIALLIRSPIHLQALVAALLCCLMQFSPRAIAADERVQLTASEVAGTFIGIPWHGPGGAFLFRASGTYSFKRFSDGKIFGPLPYRLLDDGTVMERSTRYTFFVTGSGDDARYEYFHSRSGKFYPALIRQARFLPEVAPSATPEPDQQARTSVRSFDAMPALMIEPANASRELAVFASPTCAACAQLVVDTFRTYQAEDSRLANVRTTIALAPASNLDARIAAGIMCVPTDLRAHAISRYFQQVFRSNGAGSVTEEVASARYLEVMDAFKVAPKDRERCEMAERNRAAGAELTRLVERTRLKPSSSLLLLDGRDISLPDEQGQNSTSMLEHILGELTAEQ